MKKTFLLLLCLLSFAGYAQINVKDSIQVILANDTLAPKIRYTNAHRFVRSHSSPEEAEQLGLEVIYPFVQKTWKDKANRLGYLARLQALVGECYRERGGDDCNEKERLYSEKAIQTAIESGNDTVCAHLYSIGGFVEIHRGSTNKSHEYLYQAIKYYSKMENYVKSSEMLYVIASTFYEIKDTDGLYRVLQQMEECLKKDVSKQSLYQYNVIKHCYYDLLLEKEKKEKGTVDVGLVDSMLLYIRNNIVLVENHLSELYPTWTHGYAYYFLAKGLDDYCPEQNDSILFYLDKALDMQEKETYARTTESATDVEFRAFVGVIRAQSLARNGKTEAAYKEMSEAIVLLDQLKDSKNTSVHRELAYKFMVDYYEKANRPTEALKYQKLLAASEAQRYENERMQAISALSIKYETEKKEIQIQALTEEKKNAHRILWLMAAFAVSLVVAIVLFALFARIKLKNLEMQLYEQAIVADQNHNELETIKSGMKSKPSQAAAEKLVQWIMASVLDRQTKEQYKNQLQSLVFERYDNLYLSESGKLSTMDLKYILCFAADMKTEDISTIFNVEPASVRTVKYRIKKKINKESTIFSIIR